MTPPPPPEPHRSTQRRAWIFIGIIAVLALIGASVITFAVTRSNTDTNDVHWTGFPRTQACQRLSPTDDPMAKGSGFFNYVNAAPGPDVEPLSTTITHLGDQRIRLTTTFAGFPHPVRETYLPGWGNTTQPEPYSYRAQIELFPRGDRSPHTADSVIVFDDDMTEDVHWTAGQAGDRAEQTVQRDITGTYDGHTIDLIADLAPFRDIPTGADFDPTVRVFTTRFHYPPPPQYTQPPTMWDYYPTYLCGSSSGQTPGAPVAPSLATPAVTTPNHPEVTVNFPGMDSHGFVNSHASCDPADTPVMTGQTARSQVVICQRVIGTYYYRGVRLSDGAPSEFAGAQLRNNTFEVTNATTTYSVSRQRLAITDGGDVLANEPMLEYRGP